MDVKTFNEIYDEVAYIQKYFVMIFDRNVFTIWTSENADKKYHVFSESVNCLRIAGNSLLTADSDAELDEKMVVSICRLLKLICQAVYDQDISGYNIAHQILEDESLAKYRINATKAARKIAEIIGLEEAEMINGLD